MNIGFIGAGNVAWHLAPALENAGHKVYAVISQELKNAKALTKRLYNAQAFVGLDCSQWEVELLIIAVPDDYLSDIIKELIIPENCTVVHTSGSKSLSKLGYIPTERTGVFYPLQTFSKGKKMNFKDVPILMESDNKETLKQLLSIGRSISGNVKEVHSVDRKALHVSAVFACNFTNHMLSISQQLLSEKSLDFDLLKPLLIETMNKALAIGPQNAQTGPAMRHDMELLEKHMDYLDGKPELAEIYRLISQHIIDTYPE